jgi:hypothetical protein
LLIHFEVIREIFEDGTSPLMTFGIGKNGFLLFLMQLKAQNGS